MRVPYRWLSDYVELSCAPERLAEVLTMAGVNVENVIEETLPIHGVVAGHVQAVQAHPERSALKVVTVALGDGTLKVVTGAPVEKGWCVAVAVPGACLPGNWRIEKAPVGGVMSEGMLLSATELLYGEPHVEGEGLLILPREMEAGRTLKSWYDLDDHVLELDLTPNYGHCLSMVGVAREVAAALGGKLHLPKIAPEPQLPPSEWPVELTIANVELCWRYVGKLVDGVEVGFSPLPLQRRLQLAGMRPLNNVVDATNYTMLELGQPLHAFDFEKLKKRIDVRKARSEETIVTLDGKERALEEQDLVIADDGGAVAIAGVMGGLDSEVTFSTRQVLLESAYFSPLSVRRTASRLGLRSEASARFERGVDPLGQGIAAQRCAMLLEKTASGQPREGLCDLWKHRPPTQIIELSLHRVNSVLGTTLTGERVNTLLEGLGFELETCQGARWSVTVPSYRGDVSGEIDLVEEVARAHGYDRVEATLPRKTAPGYRTQEQRQKLLAREHLLACGLDEVVTYPLVDSQRAKRLGLDQDDALTQQIKLANPLSADQDVLRNALFPGLLDVLAFNRKRQVEGAQVFEIGHVFVPPRRERLKAAVCSYGPLGTNHWRGERQMSDFFYVKGILEGLWERLGLGSWQIKPGTEGWLHPWRQAHAYVGEEVLASWGELHPTVAEAWDLPRPTVVLEMELGLMLELASEKIRFQPLPRFPAAQRDLALLVGDRVSAAEIVEVIVRHGGPYLEDVLLFDEYRGEQVPEGYRSLAYALTYRKADGTLTEEEIAEAITCVAQHLRKELDAEIR